MINVDISSYTWEYNVLWLGYGAWVSPLLLLVRRFEKKKKVDNSWKLISDFGFSNFKIICISGRLVLYPQQLQVLVIIWRTHWYQLIMAIIILSMCLTANMLSSATGLVHEENDNFHFTVASFVSVV